LSGINISKHDKYYVNVIEMQRKYLHIFNRLEELNKISEK